MKMGLVTEVIAFVSVGMVDLDMLSDLPDLSLPADIGAN